MSNKETVKLEITLAWGYAHNATRTEEWDTKITVEDWNAMSDKARQQEMDDAYQFTIEQYAQGGVSVITPGAKD